MNTCDSVQNKLSLLSFKQVQQDKSLQAHIAQCESCQIFANICQGVDENLTKLPEHDVDEAVFESTLNSILSLQEPQTQSINQKRKRNNRLASVLAASFILVSLVSLFPYNSLSNYNYFSGISSENQQIAQSPSVIEAEQEEIARVKRKQHLEERKNQPKKEDFNFYSDAVEVDDVVTRKSRRVPQKPKEITGDVLQLNQDGVGQVIGLSKSEIKINREEINLPVRIQVQDLEAPAPVYSFDRDDSTAQKDEDKVELERVVTTGAHIKASEIEKPKKDIPINMELGVVSDNSPIIAQIGSSSNENKDFRKRLKNEGIKKKMQKKIEKEQNIRDAKNYAGLFSHRSAMTTEDGFGKSNNMLPGSKGSGYISDNTVVKQVQMTSAQQFLNKWQTLKSIVYQNASGYWANTYVPGDSSMRLLKAKLQENKIDNLANSIKQNIQPFDYPRNSALAVYLSSDHAAIERNKPTRMRLQVGIQASNRKGGHRSAMNIGLVFDLTGVSGNNKQSYKNKMQALLAALLKSKQADDRISLTVAGVKGETLISAENFRHGPIQVALNNLFSKQTQSKAQSLTLEQAITQVSQDLIISDDEKATLGSSVLMLFSANSLENSDKLETIVHQNSLKGITLSTVSLDKSTNDQMKKLALAGLGHARILQSIDDAKRVINEELLASSRAVARALRLRIRLAKGVKLIRVLDSYNLDKKQSQRVRDAENALDQRLSKNLGIQADRGKDQEGIQIVIPSFYASDTHVILLDVMVTNPGEIADVSIKYKDLLYLRNATEVKQLYIPQGHKKNGPLQLNVTKNLLAYHFSQTIKKASSLIRSTNKSQAIKALIQLNDLYQSMRTQFPVWNNDSEILADEKLLQHYIQSLQTSQIDKKLINYIANVLQYIAWQKNISTAQ